MHAPTLRPAVVLLAALTALTGVVYPLAVTVVAKVVFPRQAGGSLVRNEAENGAIGGSRLIGQAFDEPRYFWSRLSATPGGPYNASAGSGSNLAPTNPRLVSAARARLVALRAVDPANDDPVPVELVTSSASGLDPHLSPAGAAYQVKRVARLRGLSPSVVAALVEAHTTPRLLGLFGEPVVNVLALNRALDARGAAQAE